MPSAWRSRNTGMVPSKQTDAAHHTYSNCISNSKFNLCLYKFKLNLRKFKLYLWKFKLNFEFHPQYHQV